MNIKKTLIFAAAILMGFGVCSCSKQNDSEVSSTAEVTESVTVTELPEQKSGLSEEQKELAMQNGISEDRYCVDDTEITEISSGLLDKYYQGMAEADFDKCFESFPDFYKKAVEDENKDYNETNEEYMKNIKQSFIDDYGDDFYIFSNVTSVLQLNDDSLKIIQQGINSTFETEKEIEIEDAYYLYFKESIRGSINKGTKALEFSVIRIDGEYYLYDSYYEDCENN